MECQICTEKFNKSNKIKISCVICNESACRACFQESLLNHEFQSCMFCHKDLQLSFLYNNFTKVWCNNVYLKKYAEICYQLEKQQFLPIFEQYEEELKSCWLLENKLNEKIITVIRYIFNKTKLYLSSTILYFNLKTITSYGANFKEKFREITLNEAYDEILNSDVLSDDLKKILLIDLEISFLFISKTIYKPYIDYFTRNVKKNIKQKSILISCPDDKCNGKLDKNMCKKCKRIVCEKCLKFISKDHKCDPNDLSNVEIAKLGKPCPSCKIIIFKGTGCDHMFCTQCHCMFNWHDLKITKTTTSPYYYEWLRSQGITPARSDNRCNRILNYYECKTILKKFPENNYLLFNACYLLHDIRMLNINLDKLKKLREQYIVCNISEEEFKKSISDIYKRNYFKSEYNYLLTSSINTISDIFLNLETHKNIELIKKELDNFRSYFNNEMINLKKMNNSLPTFYINERFVKVELVAHTDKFIERNKKEIIDLLIQIKKMSDTIITKNDYEISKKYRDAILSLPYQKTHKNFYSHCFDFYTVYFLKHFSKTSNGPSNTLHIQKNEEIEKNILELYNNIDIVVNYFNKYHCLELNELKILEIPCHLDKNDLDIHFICLKELTKKFDDLIKIIS
jgi:hypothetical protein